LALLIRAACEEATRESLAMPKPGPLYKDTPRITVPSPSITFAGKSLSIVPAPTVVIHGAMFAADIGIGPEFPAEAEVNTPLLAAPKVPIAMLSR
jgi:hypothetical protein